MDEDTTAGRGASVRWFAVAAAALSLSCVVGARSLSWLSEPGRVSFVRVAPPQPAHRLTFEAKGGIDDTPTGSIPSSALVIHLR